MGYITTISISEDFNKLAKEFNLSWTEAARIGMSILLSERDVLPYDNKLNIVRKMNVFREQAEAATQKLTELESKKK